MYYKCCIDNCTSKRQDVKLHQFPAPETGLQKWLQCINSDRLRSFTIQQLRKVFVCHKHFELRFVTETSRIRFGGYPTLFSEEEIRSGVPSIPHRDSLIENVAFDHRYDRCRRQHVDHIYAKPNTSRDEVLPLLESAGHLEQARIEEIPNLPQLPSTSGSLSEERPIEETPKLRTAYCFGKESATTVYSSSSRLNLLTKRKRLNPLTGDMSSQSMKPDRFVSQRVLSAKTHRVKQLQNQLADAQYHLQELSNENRVLRAMQKKQEIALQRYENSNAELPQVLNSHTEELRIQQTKYKQLKQQCKEALTKLKERDMQLQQLRDEHQHLLDLSKDRNLLEREKLQSQLSELQLKVQQQNETISTLQRRIVLEAKNFKHQLQAEINKHKDTRHDLDLAINNADKLSTIIEMKEKMIYSARQGRTIKSPVKSVPTQQILRPGKLSRDSDREDSRGSGDQSNLLAKLCENSRSLSSALSHDEETSSSAEPRSRYAARSRYSNSTRSTSNNTRKSSKGSDDIIEIAKTVQDGMADLAIYDDELDLKNASPDEVQKKLDAMKADLINKIKNDDSLSRKSSAVRRRSTDESIEEQISEVDEMERPKSRGRRHSNVSFYEDVTIEENTTSIVSEEIKTLDVSNPVPAARDKNKLERKLSGKPIETYCKDIISDIEKSNKVIDKHMREFSQSKFNNDTIVQHLQAVDKINDLVNANGEIPAETLTELNNNFNMITDQVFSSEAMPVARKRSVSGRRNSRVESRTNVFGDSSLSNQDLLNDLLGKK